mgnify:CR=1 FL=1
MAKTKNSTEPKTIETIIHPLPPVWNTESRVLLLGTMPSPASREAGFFYMHPQNRFWRVLPAVFGETLLYANDGTPISANRTPDRNAAIPERRDFLFRHRIALWDVLSSCDIHGAADATIRNAVPNDFCKIFESTKIRRVFCTGKTAFALWQKHCAARYENEFEVTSECLPNTSPANAQWSVARLIGEYRRILPWCD